ncbi:hypothetical protein VPH35_008778 [Triticum aestivum]
MRSCRRSRGTDNRRRAECRSFSPNVQIQMDLAEEEAEVLKSSFPRNVVISHLGRTLTHYLIYLIAVPYSSKFQ